MICNIVLIVLLISNFAMPKPKYVDLDEEEQLLLRAAYDTPPYEDENEEEDDMQLGKLDLLKDGLWAVKAKIKQLKAFNKALAANLLSTKLKLKELISNQMLVKNHYHEIPGKKKALHNYQPQSNEYAFYEQIPQYGAPQYGNDPFYGH